MFSAKLNRFLLHARTGNNAEFLGCLHMPCREVVLLWRLLTLGDRSFHHFAAGYGQRPTVYLGVELFLSLLFFHLTLRVQLVIRV